MRSARPPCSANWATPAGCAHRPARPPFTEWSWSQRSIRNDVGRLSGNVTYQGGRSGGVALQLDQVDGQWRVTGFPFRSAAVTFDALIFDFDGVLVESEWAGNKQIADWLTAHGHPTSVEESMREFMGLAGADFIGAIERWIGRALPEEFHTAREAEDERAMAEGVGEVAGAVAFIRGLPPALPKAICSSSSSAWVRRHLEHIGLEDVFGEMIFSGREHVAARQAGAGPLSPRRRGARRADRADRDHRGFAGRRHRRAGLRRDGDRPRRRPPLPRRP